MEAIDIWRELNRILWHRSERNNTYLVGLVGWMLTALSFFLVVVKAPSIAADFSSIDSSNYQHVDTWLPIPLGLRDLLIPSTSTGADVVPILFYAVTAMLLGRLLGIVFAPFGEYFGRRRWLLGVVAFGLLFHLLSAVVRDFHLFLALRALFGACMGGAWSIGAVLVMDWVPSYSRDRGRRGFVSAFFQQGYPLGNLLAAVIAILGNMSAVMLTLLHVPRLPFPGWRAMFILEGLVGLAIWAACARWLRFGESRQWHKRHKAGPQTMPGIWAPVRGIWTAMQRRMRTFFLRDGRVRCQTVHRGPSNLATFLKTLPRRIAEAPPLVFVYGIALMIAFTCMAHASQDAYPAFLQQQVWPNNAAPLVGPFDIGPYFVIVLYTLGGTIGGYFFGYASDRGTIGRRRCIIVPAFLGLLIIPLWSGLFPWGIGNLAQHKPDGLLLLLLGAFLVQFMVQGAWGVIPAHLYRISQSLFPLESPSPSAWRGIFPGFVYHVGVAFSGLALWAIAVVAKRIEDTWNTAKGSPDYSLAQAVVLALVFVALILIVALGMLVRPRGKDLEDGEMAAREAPPFASPDASRAGSPVAPAQPA